jgi:hypothetical protein
MPSTDSPGSIQLEHEEFIIRTGRAFLVDRYVLHPALGVPVYGFAALTNKRLHWEKAGWTLLGKRQPDANLQLSDIQAVRLSRFFWHWYLAVSVGGRQWWFVFGGWQFFPTYSKSGAEAWVSQIRQLIRERG